MNLGTETQEAMVAVYTNADPDWKAVAKETILRLARQNEVFTSLEVVTALEAEQVKTHDLRAIGPLLVMAAKAGTITHESFIRRNDKHNRGTTVLWRSNVFQG